MDANEQLTSDLSELTKSVGVLAKGLENMQGIMTQQGSTQTQLGQAITDISKTLSEGIKTQAPPKGEETPDMSEMSVGEVATYFLSEVKKMQENTNAKTEEKLSGMAQKLDRKDRTAELERARSAEGNEDFDDWLPEMKDLAESNPTLSINRLLGLARLENPEKATELREVIDAKKAEANPPEKEEPYTGMTPTSGGATIVDESGEPKRMDLKEGLAAAFDSVVPDRLKQELASEESLF